MILAIDIGNTSAKYAVMDNKSEILFFERLKGSWKSAFEKVIEKYNDIKEIYISNVAGEQSELEAVRMYPNVYLGSDDLAGATQTIYEILANSFSYSHSLL